MKINGFFKDVKGAGRVTEQRQKLFEEASGEVVKHDPINEVAKALHPDNITFEVTKIKQVSPTAKTIRFISKDVPLPVFQAGQYVSFNFHIGKTYTTRPYSISSAPFETRSENPFIEITVRNKGDCYVSKYLCEDLKVGDVLTGSLPYGQFYFEDLRDSKNVVAIAGGSGITPFYSMAREIKYGKADFNLTIIYGSDKSNDIILKKELEDVECDRVKVVHVLSNDDSWKGEKGFITSDIIKKYSVPDCTYFMCGPQVMYRFVSKELEKLNIKERRIRKEVFGTPKDVSVYKGYPKKLLTNTYKIHVIRGINETEVIGKASETLAVSLERAGILIKTRCRSGECGCCRSKLVSGDVFVSPDGDGRRMEDKKHGYIHLCATYPISDVIIKIPIVENL